MRNRAMPLIVFLLALLAAGPLPAMPGAAERSSLARHINCLEALLRVARHRVRMAEAEHAARQADPVPDDWVATVRADAARFDGEGIIKVRQAEAALAESDLHEEQCRLFSWHTVPERSRVAFGAMLQLCAQRAAKAEGVALLAVQGAQALYAKSVARLAMAEAMARCAAFSANRTPEHLQAALNACDAVVAAMEMADDTVGVHLEFLEAQEADFNRVLAALLPADS
jgi:hypothetical protein